MIRRLRQLADAAMDIVKELGGAALVVIVANVTGGLGAAVLAVLGLGGVFFVSRWRWPFKPCSSCRSTGRNKGSNRRRHGDCKRCGGTRRVKRPGAVPVHRAILTIRNRGDKEK